MSRMAMIVFVFFTASATGAFAEVFTIGKNDAQDPDGWAYYIGQTFTPSEQGPHGSGNLPSDDTTVFLHSFRVDPWDPAAERGGGPVAEPLPDDAYLYPASLLPADSDQAEVGNGGGIGFNLGRAVLAGEGDGYLGEPGEYVFDTPVELQMSDNYAFFLTEAAGIEYWQSTPYEGGEAYWTDGSTRGTNYEIKDFNTDLDFEAVFSTNGVIPEPTSVLLLSAGAILLCRGRRC